MAFSDLRIHLGIDSGGAKAIDEYLEYRRIVGDDDGGTLFTPEQYEAYKKEKIPMRLTNRIFTCWASVNTGIECKMIGPENKCFCQHRYKQHRTDFGVIPEKRPIRLPCEVKSCGCKSYSYVPSNGSQPIRCTCKHTSDDHSVIGKKKCKKPSCDCSKFHSSFTCGCGDPCYNHKMIIETKEERQSRGKPIGHDVPYKAMGGLTGFSSLADGYMRLDDSGIGAPSKQFLKQPASAFDHPFLKMHSNMKELSMSDTDQPSQSVANRRTTEADDMAYFERRYQQRLKEERQTARLKNNARPPLEHGMKQHKSLPSRVAESEPKRSPSNRSTVASGGSNKTIFSTRSRTAGRSSSMHTAQP